MTHPAGRLTVPTTLRSAAFAAAGPGRGGTAPAALIRVGAVQDRPSAAELLATIGEYLDQDVLPLMQGNLRYHTLVAANLVAILGREVQAGLGPVRRERADLAALLGEAAAAGTDAEDLDESVLRLHGALQQRLLGPELPEREFLLAARDALERATLAKLAINKPGYERYDMAVEVP